MINIVYSTQHWIVPRILMVVIAALGLLILVLKARKRVKAGGSVLPKLGRFFEENYDKVKFWGALALMAGYFFLLDKIGFTVCSILFLYLFNTLFGGKARLKDKRYHLNSILISVVACVLVSAMFGTVFAITLPSGICTIEIPAWNFILY